MPSGEAVLRVMQALHAYAAEARRLGAQEGLVYDWLPLAVSGGIVTRTWYAVAPPTLRLVATTVRVPPPLSRSSSNLAGLIHSLIRRPPSP